MRDEELDRWSSGPRGSLTFGALEWSFICTPYSHNLAEPDSAQEIDTGMRAFEKAFGERPVGYRAPEGRISEGGLQRLAERHFLFDSRVFPPPGRIRGTWGIHARRIGRARAISSRFPLPRRGARAFW